MNNEKITAFGYNLAKGLCKIIDNPTKKTAQSGKTFATARASYTFYSNNPGEAYTTYFSFIAFGKTGDKLITNFKAGDMIRFVGKIYQNKFLNPEKNTETTSLNVHLLSMSRLDYSDQQNSEEYFIIETLGTISQDPKTINDDNMLLNICYANNSNEAEFMSIFTKKKHIERLNSNERANIKKGKILGIKFTPYGVTKTTSTGKVYRGISGQANAIFYVEDLLEHSPIIAQEAPEVYKSTEQLFKELFLE